MAAKPTAGPKVQEQFPDIVFSKITPASEHPRFNYQGFNPGQVVLEEGHAKAEGCRPFPVKSILDRDTAIPMRDGVRLYADIFRPANSDQEPVPAILPWSPYGKSGAGPKGYAVMAPFAAGIPQGKLSGYEKFEAPDPAEWCGRGYAVVNIDARGAGNSEGVIAAFGNQEAEDVYDTIDWLAGQPWCNGSVVMAGNSWLAISQINFAARMKHPALKALAPWECFSDMYRQFIARGGRFHIPAFHRGVSHGLAGPDAVENVGIMLTNRPLYDDYWEAKRIPVEKIDGVPLYMLASYSSMLHTYGSLLTYRVAPTPTKWLRVHPFQEWHDIYRDEISDELQRYFDRYAKGVKNGWEDTTPPVRLSLLGFDHQSSAKTVLERPESSYPLERQELRTFFLDSASRSLQQRIPTEEGETSYESHHLTASADFCLYFDRPTELAGYSKATLWMSTPDHDDMDVTVQIRKINSKGELLKHLNYPCPVPEAEVPDVNIAKTLGPQGFLRASHRVSLDRDHSASDVDLFYTHREREEIPPGKKVRLEIPLWPIGMVFAPGEGIMLRVAGHDLCLPEAEPMRVLVPEDENVGTHTIHTGGDFDSSLTIPFILG